MTSSKISILSIFCLTSLLANCTTIKTVNQAPRADVQFASAEAADTFYQALIRNTTPHNDKDEGTFMIGLTKPYQSRRIDSDNVIFNRASARADANGNRWITEQEAAFYSESTDRIE